MLFYLLSELERSYHFGRWFLYLTGETEADHTTTVGFDHTETLTISQELPDSSRPHIVRDLQIQHCFQKQTSGLNTYFVAVLSWIACL